MSTVGLTVDAGALIALDQPSKARRMQWHIDTTRHRGGSICIPVEALAREGGHGILTSDPDDLKKVDPKVPLIQV